MLDFLRNVEGISQKYNMFYILAQTDIHHRIQCVLHPRIQKYSSQITMMLMHLFKINPAWFLYLYTLDIHDFPCMIEMISYPIQTTI